MSERPRMTVVIDGEVKGSREVQLLLNPVARDLLVAELMKLDRSNDHFHLLSFEEWSELTLSTIPYTTGDELVPAVKVSLRYDDWDAEHFPHVMATPADP